MRTTKKRALEKFGITYPLIFIVSNLIWLIVSFFHKEYEIYKFGIKTLIELFSLIIASIIICNSINKTEGMNKKDIKKLILYLGLILLFMGLVTGYFNYTLYKPFNNNIITISINLIHLLILSYVYNNIDYYKEKEVRNLDYDPKEVWTDHTEVVVNEVKEVEEAIKLVEEDEEKNKEVLSPIKLKTDIELETEKSIELSNIEKNSKLNTLNPTTENGTIAFHGFDGLIEEPEEDKIEIKQEVKFHYPSEEENNTKTCPNCGMKLQTDAEVCFMCGTKQ
jgi:ribosomal protein L40E